MFTFGGKKKKHLENAVRENNNLITLSSQISTVDIWSLIGNLYYLYMCEYIHSHIIS